jgi:signal transduction histidine kinase
VTGKVVHDFNNVLAVIMSGALLVKSKTQDQKSLRALENVVNAIESGTLLCRQILSYGQLERDGKEQCLLDEVVEQTSSMLNLVVYGNHRLDKQLACKDVSVRVDPVKLQQLVMNLVVNARDALDEEGHICIRTRCPSREEGERAILEVEDDGQGMSDEVKGQITSRNFTAKEGGGTGLGLAVVSEIVSEAGGELEIESTLGEGTTIRARLPIASERSEPGS